MFPAYPGFENLPLRVEVQWRGAARSVVVRVEQWPDSDKAVIICAFENDEAAGEWLIMGSENIYRLSAPNRLLCRCATYDIATRTPHLWSEHGQNRLRALVRRAFDRLGVAAVYALSEIRAPHIVIDGGGSLSWCCGLERSSFVPFELSQESSNDAREAQLQLQNAWCDRESDAHFAWRWAGYSEGERLFLLTGYDGKPNEMERTMKRILQRMNGLWLLESGWTWKLSAGEGELWSQSESIKLAEEKVETWSWLLRRHYFPELGYLLRREHLCVQKSWAKQVRSTRVEVTTPPTAHEQLEAHLWLRDWLQDKVTPEQSKSLLAVLDEPLNF